MHRLDSNPAFRTPTRLTMKNHDETDSRGGTPAQPAVPAADDDPPPVTAVLRSQLFFAEDNAMDQFSVSGQFSNNVNEAIDNTLALATEAHAVKRTPEKMVGQATNAFTTPKSLRSKAPERTQRSPTDSDSSKRQAGWWRKTLASPLGFTSQGPPPKSPKKREHIPCDEVKPGSAKNPYHEILSYEPPIQEGPCWIKHPVKAFRCSPVKKPPVPR